MQSQIMQCPTVEVKVANTENVQKLTLKRSLFSHSSISSNMTLTVSPAEQKPLSSPSSGKRILKTKCNLQNLVQKWLLKNKTCEDPNPHDSNSDGVLISGKSGSFCGFPMFTRSRASHLQARKGKQYSNLHTLRDNSYACAATATIRPAEFGTPLNMCKTPHDLHEKRPSKQNER